MRNPINHAPMTKKTENQDIILAQPNHIKLFEGRQMSNGIL